MQDPNLDILDPTLFENNLDLDLDYGTPLPVTFASQGWNLANQAQQPEPNVHNSPSEVLDSLSSFNIPWKLQLRKGRMMTLTGDTVEGVNITPGKFWDTRFKSEILDVVKEHVPEPQYKPDETRITISTSKRAQRDFTKRFSGLNIDWILVENKLRSWSNQGDTLTVEIWFIYKEVPVDTTNKVGKSGRGATAKQLAARDKYIAQQEAAGIRPVWKDVYELFECTSVVCPNRGFSCWRDPSNQRHYKLDSDTMERLVEFAEEGNKLEKQDDIPDRIREIIYKHEEEEAARKQLKRKASDQHPTTIHICCHGHQGEGCSETSGTPQKAPRLVGSIRQKFPMPLDKATDPYTEWLCEKVTNVKWQEAYRLAGSMAENKGYDLGQLFEAQDVQAKMLATGGVLPGIAEQYVSRIGEWLDEICA